MRSMREAGLRQCAGALMAALLWLAYGFALDNWALIVPNTVAAIVITATMVVTVRYRRPRE